MRHMETGTRYATDVKQPSLFPPANRTATSRAAAKSVSGITGALRQRVYRYVCEHGGATEEEIADGLGMRRSTVCPRVWELLRDGYVVDSGETRKTTSGRQARVVKVAG
jgi:predicted transcriptional regulator